MTGKTVTVKTVTLKNYEYDPLRDFESLQGVSSSVEALDGSSSEPYIGTLKDTIREEWGKNTYRCGNPTYCPSACVSSNVENGRATAVKELRIDTAANDLDYEDQIYYSSHNKAVDCSFPMEEEVDRPFTQRMEVNVDAQLKPRDWLENHLYQGRNLSHPAPIEHMRWLSVLWEAFQLARLTASVNECELSILAPTCIIRENLLFNIRTLEIFGLLVVGSPPTNQPRAGHRKAVHYPVSGTSKENSSPLIADELPVHHAKMHNNIGHDRLPTLMANSFTGQCRKYLAQAVDYVNLIRHYLTIPITAITGNHMERISSNTLLHPRSEVKLREMLGDLARKEGVSILIGAPTVSPMINFEEFVVLFAKYLPNKYAVPKSYCEDTRPFGDNHEWLRPVPETSASGHISMGSRFVRDGILGVDMSATEARMPGHGIHPTTVQMEPPTLGLAMSSHMQKIFESQAERRVERMDAKEESKIARDANLSERQEVLARCLQEIKFSRGGPRTKGPREPQQLSDLRNELQNVPDVDKLGVDEADFRLRFFAERLCRMENESAQLRSSVQISMDDGFQKRLEGQSDLMWHDDEFNDGEVDRFAMKAPKNGYYVKDRPHVLTEAEIYQAGLCPPDLRAIPDAPIVVSADYELERARRLELKIAELEEEDNATFKEECLKYESKRNKRIAEMKKTEWKLVQKEKQEQGRRRRNLNAKRSSMNERKLREDVFMQHLSSTSSQNIWSSTQSSPSGISSSSAEHESSSALSSITDISDML
eukprot:GHVH01014593.1.p2 GENE.GHVH01014593.1~~GHVH01014593.1.p2  ORF type:complete len:765 (+),score=103.96 GHVH01014593.1:2913-5207(+)